MIARETTRALDWIHPVGLDEHVPGRSTVPLVWRRCGCYDRTVTQRPRVSEQDLPPDPVVELYKRDVDRTLIRENLRLTAQQRSAKFERNMRMLFELRRSVRDGANKDPARRGPQ